MEFVYVVPRAELFRDCYPQGFQPFAGAAEAERFSRTLQEQGFFVEREYAERTPRLKQVIPYTLTWIEGRILLLKRLSAGGEARLHGKLSIGVGGHINPEDLSAAGQDPIRAGTQREIEEELDVRGSYEVRTLGFLNDDSNPVGAVHLGLVQIAHVSGSVGIRETDQLEGRLTSPDTLKELESQGENFETWSAILIERLDELLPAREPVTAES